MRSRGRGCEGQVGSALLQRWRPGALVHGSSTRSRRRQKSEPQIQVKCLNQKKNSPVAERNFRLVKCLDNKWLGVPHRYRFRCWQGHEWFRTGAEQKKRAGCPACSFAAMGLAQRKPENLVRLQVIARVHGGICLSTEYRRTADKFAFRCPAGHEWQAHAQAIFAGSWCRRCGGGGPLKMAHRAATRLAHLQRDLCAEICSSCRISDSLATSG